MGSEIVFISKIVLNFYYWNSPQMSTPICTSCYENYSQSNPARILNKCSHSFCSNCILNFKVCPVDNIPVGFAGFAKNKLDTFRINTAIMRDMMKKDSNLRKSAQIMAPTLSMSRKSSNRQEEYYRCLLHDKPLDLVCIDHLKRICSGCALFGDHKLHKVQTIEKVLSDCSIVGQHALNILSQLVVKEETLSQEAIISSVTENLKERRDNLAKNIRTKFKKLVDKLRKLEMETIKNLDKIMQAQKQQLLKEIRLEQILGKKNGWLNQAKRLIDLVEKLTNDKYAEQAARYLNENCYESSVAHRGDYLLIEIQSFQTNMQKKFEKYKQDLLVEEDESIEQKLDNFMTIYRAMDKQKKFIVDNKKQIQGQEYLLQEGLTIENKQQDGLTPDTCETLCNINQLIPEPLDPYYINYTEPSVTEVRQIKESDILIRDMRSMSISEIRKKKKIKVPEKYDAIVEDLRNDRCQTIDLGGAELGDAVIISLCDFIRCSQKLKILKLVRNKLTNDSLQPIIEACVEAGVVSLNLGQNLMTDQAIDFLQKIPLNQLKAITLSQNKLRERYCKPKLMQFKKRGVTLSI